MGSASTSPISLQDVVIGARFLFRLPSFLTHPVNLAEARAILLRRLENQESDFLSVARNIIYPNPANPYRQLLDLVGCQYGDLERLVRQDGIEGALRSLLRKGVFLSVNEFRGREPVIRGSSTIAVDPFQLRNPLSAVHMPVQTGGSRSGGTQIPMDLAFMRDRSVDTCLSLNARSGDGWVKAIWGVPGGFAIAVALEFSGFGSPLERCFFLVDPAARGLHPRYRWSIRALQWAGFLTPRRLPKPQCVAIDDPLPIAHWMAGVLRSGKVPLLFTFSSPAVILCHTAAKAGLDLRGARFMMTGEPITKARLDIVRQVGAKAEPRYAATECGPIAYGCLAPEASDEVHLASDLHALIQPGEDGARWRLPPNALLVSSLRPTAPLVLFNTSMGDQSFVSRRKCGCSVERLGWTTHLHTIRSYEKLTAAGMTFLDAEVIEVLEEVLPKRFGGMPTDYQLVETEDERGRPRLKLLVHPEVGSLNPEAVKETFLEAISKGSGAEQVMGLVWRDAKLIQIERHPPLATSSGKILHLHLERCPE